MTGSISRRRYASVAGAPDIFVDLLDATVRSARNYHRLDHCSFVRAARPKSGFRLRKKPSPIFSWGNSQVTSMTSWPRARFAARVPVPTGTAIPTALSADSRSGPDQAREGGLAGAAGPAPTRTSSSRSAARILAAARTGSAARNCGSWSRPSVPILAGRRSGLTGLSTASSWRSRQPMVPSRITPCMSSSPAHTTALPLRARAPCPPRTGRSCSPPPPPPAPRPCRAVR